MKLPTWPPRDWRALLALLASVLGATLLTALAAGIVVILWAGTWPVATAGVRIAILGRALLLALGGSLVVLTSLGLAINRRSIKVDRAGFEMTGGDDAAPAPLVTTTTTTAVAP